MDNEAERYRIIQEKSSLSKVAFAESLGISRAHYYHIETGKQNPPKGILERLASVYKVNLNWLINGTGYPENETADIELYDLEVAAGYGRDIAEFPELKYLPIPKSFFTPISPKTLKSSMFSGTA